MPHLRGWRLSDLAPGIISLRADMHPCRILCIDETSGFGGALTALATAIPHLVRQGFEVHVVLTTTEERCQRVIREVTPHVYVLPFARRPFEPNERLAELGRRGLCRKWAVLLPLTVKELIG